MGCDLEIKCSRLITVNKTGKVETQSYSIFPVSFNRDKCDLIINSIDPYSEWCKQVKEQYNNNNTPIFIWDLEENYGKPEMMKREEAFLEDGSEQAKSEDIVGYSNLGDEIIKYLDIEIKDAIDNDYDLQWMIGY